MNKQIYHFCLSAALYWIVEQYAGAVLIMPEKIISVAVFLPPMLGLMWGPVAAAGVYLGGILSEPNLSEGIEFLIRDFWIFLAGYLPYYLWQKIWVEKENAPTLRVRTLKKILLILFITFVTTSAWRTITAPAADFEVFKNWLLVERKATVAIYFSMCLLNDFFVAIFLDLAWFFFLTRGDYQFYNQQKSDASSIIGDTKLARLVVFGGYLFFPAGVIYLNRFQIYGMEDIKVWLQFVAECLSMIDVYMILMIYLTLQHRRSIMMEIVFLVSQTVFLSATVLGFGSSVAMGSMVNSHANDSLHAMSVICRERLTRTFFLVRQAVNSMRLQALESLESYERLANDSDYRKNYLEAMKNNFAFDSLGIDGGISFYLRLIPEIEGTKGGFSMQREEARWEGVLAPFVEREPVDLAPYSPDDIQNVGWYYIPMKSRCATWIEPYIDAVTDFYVISYVAPLFVEGKFIGVVGMDVDFNFIIQELRRMSIYDYGYVYLMNRNNLVLYHKDQPQGALFQPNPEFQEMELYLANGMWLGIAMPLSRVHEERNRILMHLIFAIIIVAMLISLISISLAAKAIRPLAGMTEAAKRIASGDLNVKISYESGNELGILVRSIREMAAKLEGYVYRDKLTGLLNAAAYLSKRNELDAHSKSNPALQYGVIIFDVNFLKKVNDNYGHEAGNELLRHAAKVMAKVFTNSSVYRVGGDEFAAIVENQDYENRAELLKIFDEQVAAETFQAAGETINLSVARGLGEYSAGMEFAAVSKIADVAMYNHKAAIKAKYGEEVR